MKNLSFSNALSALKSGIRVRRKGWNGKGMWLVLIDSWTIDVKYASKVLGLLPLGFIAMKTADDCLVPWVASQTDILANDWEVFDDVESQTNILQIGAAA